MVAARAAAYRGRMNREPKTIYSNNLDEAMQQALARAASTQEPMRFDDGLYLVQRLEEHNDTGAGHIVSSYELIPVDETGA